MPENAFEALCKVASEKEWCWNLVCTTCGHEDFRMGLVQISRRIHPESEKWVPPDVIRSSDPRLTESLRDRRAFFHREPLYLICASANIASIAATCRFPDFLGYLGLALHYQERMETQYRLLTRLWGSDLLKLMDERAAEVLRADLDRPDFVLSWRDLERVEYGIDRRRLEALREQ
ncbi:MAG: hypothetical protein IPM28_09535 [Chloracidobacterium sp.]|nr:hypothetical protein [Chloracidobacterium sp.]